LTAGSGVTITNASGAITIASSGASAATPTALGTVYGSMTTTGGSPYLTALGYNAGAANTGNGGSAGNQTGGPAGGSGIAIIRYPDIYKDPVSTTGTKTTYAGYKAFTFTSSGSIVF
jgi:hypothetical protein